MTAHDDNERRKAWQREERERIARLYEPPELPERPQDERKREGQIVELREEAYELHKGILLDQFSAREHFTLAECAMLACGKDPRLYSVTNDATASALRTEWNARPLEFRGVKSLRKPLADAVASFADVHDLINAASKKDSTLRFVHKPDIEGEDKPDPLRTVIRRADFERWRAEYECGTVPLPGSAPPSGDSNDKRLSPEERIERLPSIIRELGFDPMAVTREQLTALRAHCLNQYLSVGFTESTFKSAWQLATTRELVKSTMREAFSSTKNKKVVRK